MPIGAGVASLEEVHARPSLSPFPLLLIARVFADDVMSPALRFNNEACSLKVRLYLTRKREEGKGEDYHPGTSAVPSLPMAPSSVHESCKSWGVYTQSNETQGS